VARVPQLSHITQEIAGATIEMFVIHFKNDKMMSGKRHQCRAPSACDLRRDETPPRKSAALIPGQAALVCLVAQIYTTVKVGWRSTRIPELGRILLALDGIRQIRKDAIRR
jgi:hypothetical protein